MSIPLAMIQGLGQKARADESQDCFTPTEQPSPSVDLEFHNITLTVSEGIRKRKTKIILKGVSGLFKSGQLTAIMGPSGAGKSSLMNALTGFSTKGVAGTIRAGDSVCELGKHHNKTLSSLKAYRKKSCYILQDDRICPLFTVSEQMKFAADMKLGNSMTEKLKKTVISEVIDSLGLAGTEGTKCANLSGGQRKRLSIALELIDNPPVIFLDEPTTGLDSSTSAQCIEMLKNLARSGRTVVCTIHQPSASIYSLFDQVYILAEGMCVYNGASENTVSYLASVGLQCPKYHNPADYILEIANGEYGSFNELLSEECLKKDWTKKAPLVLGAQEKVEGYMLNSKLAIRPPNAFYKFGVMFKRCLVQQYRDWTVTHLKVLSHFIVGMLIGFIFGDSGSDGSKTFSNLGYLMISVVYLYYTSLMPGVLRFPAELSIIKKETFNNWYSLKTYYVAVLVTGIPMQIWYSFVYSAPSYILTGQPLEWSRFAMFVLVLAHITLIADAVGNAIGTCVNPINGTFLGAIFTCAMVVMGGFLVLLSHMLPLMRALSYTSFVRHAFEGLMLSVYAFNRPPLHCPEDKIYCHMKYPKEVVKQFSFKMDNYSTDIAILLGTLIVIRIIAYLTLKRNTKIMK